MTIEYLEEQLSEALAEIEELKDIISELLPINENGECLFCARGEKSYYGFHYGTLPDQELTLCLSHESYNRACKVLNADSPESERAN